MGKLLVVIIDLDEAYVTALERKFVESLGEYADISIITDMCYFNEYFSIPRDIDVLVINEQLYNQQLSSHNIEVTYILTENLTENNPENEKKYIYKYTSVQDIFLQISCNEVIKKVIDENGGNSTKVLLMHSPIGGVGTTTMSIGVAALLKKLGYSVIYISMENMQSFINYMNKKNVWDSENKEHIKKADSTTYSAIKSSIVQGEFDYLPAFSESLNKLDITIKDYIPLLDSIKNAKEYDYIILDTDSYFSDGLLSVMNEVDKNIILTNQSKVACHKLEKMGRELEGVSGEKFMIICNKYNENITNNITLYNGVFYVTDYIYYEDSLVDGTLENIASSSEIARVIKYIVNS